MPSFTKKIKKALNYNIHLAEMDALPIFSSAAEIHCQFPLFGSTIDGIIWDPILSMFGVSSCVPPKIHSFGLQWFLAPVVVDPFIGGSQISKPT